MNKYTPNNSPIKKFNCQILGLASVLVVVLIIIWKSSAPSALSNLQIENEVFNDVSGDDYDPSSFYARAKRKPWYFENGTVFPKPAVYSPLLKKRDAKLLPSEEWGRDRFTNQMMFIPPNYESIRASKKFKTILSYEQPAPWWKLKEGTELFKELKCPVDTCRITANRAEMNTADIILLRDLISIPPENRTSTQRYAWYELEPPHHTKPFIQKDLINWTITYRHDSTIPAPYTKWLYYDPRIRQIKQHQNYAANRTKKVAWLVSNCNTPNGRTDYAKELQKYIDVDIYGSCGPLKCPCSEQKKCFELLRKDYKFYLSFENNNCRDYITEKFYETGLVHKMLPIVMGPPREDYEKYGPERSFIHVEDFNSPKDLAEYLHLLDRNDEMYNSYFKWRGTGEFIDSWKYLWCRLCAVLHDDYTMSIPRWVNDINDWWRNHNICNPHKNLTWRQFLNLKP